MNTRKPPMTTPTPMHDDPLDDLFNSAKAGTVRPAPDLPAGYQPKTNFEPCSKCRGTGMTPWGVCFRCQGKKGKTFKTSPEQRQRKQAQAANRREVKRVEKVAEQKAWREAHKAEVTWLMAAADKQLTRAHLPGAKTWSFPIELANKLGDYGTLTEGQIGAIRKCMAKD